MKKNFILINQLLKKSTNYKKLLNSLSSKVQNDCNICINFIFEDNCILEDPLFKDKDKDYLFQESLYYSSWAIALHKEIINKDNIFYIYQKNLFKKYPLIKNNIELLLENLMKNKKKGKIKFFILPFLPF